MDSSRVSTSGFTKSMAGGKRVSRLNFYVFSLDLWHPRCNLKYFCTVTRKADSSVGVLLHCLVSPPSRRLGGMGAALTCGVEGAPEIAQSCTTAGVRPRPLAPRLGFVPQCQCPSPQTRWDSPTYTWVLAP